MISNRQLTIGLFSIIFLFILGVYVDYVARDKIITGLENVIFTTQILFIVILSFVAICCIGSVVLYLLMSYEKYQTIRANRQKSQSEKDFHSIVSEHGIFIREMDDNVTWRLLHLNQSPYQNGKQAKISQDEKDAWLLWVSRQKSQQTLALPASISSQDPQPSNLLDMLKNQDRVLVKGVSDAGKTSLLQWIATQRRLDGKVLVIDPHSSPDKWNGCQVVGMGRKHDEIESVLSILIDLMTERYEEIAEGKVREGEHPKITIIIDEWMSIAYQCKDAKNAIISLLTEGRKASLAILVGSHSERVASLGLDGKGDLREGFCFVRLSIENDERSATIDYGNGELPALLLGAYPEVNNQEIIEIKTDKQKVIEKYEEGKDISIIAEEVFKWKGGNQNKKVEEILGL